MKPLKPRIKFVILAVFVVLLVVAGILLAKLGPYKCVRSDCIRKANYMLANMNVSIDPCDNFFKFACDNFIKIEPYRRDGFVCVIDRIKYDIQSKIDALLNDPLKISDDRILKIVKKMYQPCVNIKLITLGTQPLWDAIWMTGGFPVVEGTDWNEETFSLGDIEYKSRKSGFTAQHIFKCTVEQNPKNHLKFSVIIQPPSPPSVRKLPGYEVVDEPYSEKLITNYASFIVRLVFHLLGLVDYEKEEYKEQRERFETELNTTIEFKVALARHLKMFGFEQDPLDLYNSMTLDNLEEDFPYVNWKHLLEKMIGSHDRLPDEVVLIGTSYFRSIKKLIESTPKRVLANFFMLENTLEGCLFLPENFFSVYNKFRYNINMKLAERTPFCDAMVKNTLRGALSSLFIQTYNITKASQPILDSMTQRMQTYIRQSLDELDWMDDKTKEGAILKLKNMKLTLSLRDDQLLQLKDEEARAIYYEDLCLGSRYTQILPSYFCINKFHLKKNWELLGKREPEVFDENVDVFTPQIKYLPSTNELLVPYGVLTFPTFDGLWPNYINYGGVGSIVGETLTQGFDSNGAFYNENGFKKYWWTGETQARYDKESDCYQKQYVKFGGEEGVNIKKDINISQSVSNFQGARLASWAYENYYKERYIKEQSLPGLENYTFKQLFYLSYANIYCAYYKEKRYSYDLKRGSIPYDYKIIGSLQNSDDFNKEFQCSNKDPMNLNNKCKFLW